MRTPTARLCIIISVILGEASIVRFEGVFFYSIIYIHRFLDALDEAVSTDLTRRDSIDGRGGNSIIDRRLHWRKVLSTRLFYHHFLIL